MTNTKNNSDSKHPKTKMVVYIDSLGNEYEIETSNLELKDSIKLGFNPFSKTKTITKSDKISNTAKRLYDLFPRS